MIKLFFILIFSFITQSINSQVIKLTYNLEIIKDTLTKNKENRDMVLLIKGNNYLFCPQSLLYKDSLKNNKLDYSNVILEEEIEFTTLKSTDLITKIYSIDDKLYSTKEKFANLKWDIQNVNKKIDNFECQLATLNYKGRIWQAWFSKEYPINKGPYIFNGLPGVIVELKDNKSNYSFKLSGISSKSTFNDTSLNPSIIGKPIVINKNQLNKLYLTIYSDPFKRMKDKNIVAMYDEKTGQQEPPPDFIKMTKTAQKYIRENNNPIEISEAIKYK